MSFLGTRRRSVVAAAAALAMTVMIAGCGSDGATTESSVTSTAVDVTSTSIVAGAPTTAGATVPPSTDAQVSTTAAPSVPLPDVPTGSFLSSHRLSLTGTGVPSTARSVCQTTPGANCVIHFTKGDTTRSLPVQEVDASGTTSWDWTPAQIGLETGHWAVRIVVSNDAGQRSVDEAIGLDVVD